MTPKQIAALISLIIAITTIVIHFVLFYKHHKSETKLTTQPDTKIKFFETLKQYWILFIGLALLIPGIVLWIQ